MFVVHQNVRQDCRKGLESSIGALGLFRQISGPNSWSRILQHYCHTHSFASFFVDALSVRVTAFIGLLRVFLDLPTKRVEQDLNQVFGGQP